MSKRTALSVVIGRFRVFQFLKSIMKKLRKKSQTFQLKIKRLRGSRWSRVNTEVGHVPLFDIVCNTTMEKDGKVFMCGHKMFLRFSEVTAKPIGKLGIKRPVNIIAMKCPECARVQRFYIEDSKKYLQKVLDRRGGRMHYHPSFEEWSNMSEAIKRKLKSLGYWG